MATESTLKVGIERFPHLYIGGEWVSPASGRMIESINPATGRVWAEAAEADEKSVDKAVRAARGAFEMSRRSRAGSSDQCADSSRRWRS